VSRQGTPFVLRPSGVAGAVLLTAYFNTQTASAGVLVSTETASVRDVTLSVPGLAASSGVLAFGGVHSKSIQPMPSLSFDDGTILPDTSTFDWIPMSSLLALTSTEPATLATDDEGGLTLFDNHWEPVRVTATALCSASNQQGSVPIAPNLEPSLGNVDFGADSGLQHQQQGTTLEVVVRANAEVGRFVAHQVEMMFDPAVFQATACVAGAVSGFTCTLQDPVERALLVAADGVPTASGRAVWLGTVTLKVKASAVTLIRGDIVELVRYAS